MIIELFLNPIFYLINIIIDSLPAAFSLPAWGLETMNLISKGLFFFPSDVWSVVITNVMFWLATHLGWSGIEWIYKKIPGVN